MAVLPVCIVFVTALKILAALFLKNVVMSLMC